MHNPPKKVLIVRFSSIGDIVLCSPVVRCVKQQWGAEVHFITKNKFANIVSPSPYVDEVIGIDDKVSEVKDRLTDEKYDLVIDLHKNIRSQQVRSITKCKYVTFDKINIEKWITVHTPWNILPKNHLVDRYFEGLSKVGLQNDGKGLDHFFTAEEEQKAEQLFTNNYAVLSLGATYKTKRLPLEKWQSLLKSITLPIVLIGGNDVGPQAEALAKHSSQPITNMVGRATIGLSSAIIAGASFVVSGDSGMMHIAAAHSKPLIVPWGSTHPSLGMYPYYPDGSSIAYEPLCLDLSCQPCSKIGKKECPKGHFNCMNNLSDEMLAKAVKRIEAAVLIS